METYPVSETFSFLVFRIPADRQSPETQSKWSYFTTDGRSVSMSWCRAPLWGPWPDFTFCFLFPEICFPLRLGAPCLTRGRVCNL
jgi:hypothetical protein